MTLDGQHWVSARPGFLFPVHALSKVFRGKFLAGLGQLRARNALRFIGDSAPLAGEQAWSAWLRDLRTREWVVYAKPPFGGPERVLKYLSRYTHRVASAHPCALDAAVLGALAARTTIGDRLLPLRQPLACASASRCDPPPLPTTTPAPDQSP